MNGTEQTRIIYWDACVYLAWLMEEKSHGKVHMDAIAQIANENFQRKNVIITSTITFIEVMASKIRAEKEALFRKSFRTGDHIAYDVDPPIALRARELRENLAKHESGKNLSTPDAIHIATALIYKADCLFSFDDGQKEKRHLGLLELNKDARVDGLEICKPNVPQQELGLATPVPALPPVSPQTTRPSRRFKL
jgi:predicted nucleic acid-binding protein